MRSPRLILAIALLVLFTTTGCALANLLVGVPTVTPIAQRQLRPTFTPTPTRLPPTPLPDPAVAQAPAPAEAAPAEPLLEAPAAPLQDAVAPLEAIQIEPPTPEPPTPEPPTPEPPTATPTPFVVVAGDLVRARSGPGTSYDELAQLAADAELTIVGRNEAGDWWQVCCVDGQTAWVSGELVTVQGGVDAVAVATNIPPSPTPTATPEPQPFVVARVPLVNVRSGPGVDFDLVGQVEQGQRLQVVARNQDSTWWQVCCVDGQQGWIVDDLVASEGPFDKVALSPDLPEATTTATRPPAQAMAFPSPTPEPDDYPFVIAERETFPFGRNDYFRVAAKISDETGRPLGGYFLRIRNETTGQEWLSRQSGNVAWEYSAPSTAFADFRELNAQFDTNGQAALSDNVYAVWLVNTAGQKASKTVRHQPDDGELQWLYVVFTRQ